MLSIPFIFKCVTPLYIVLTLFGNQTSISYLRKADLLYQNVSLNTQMCCKHIFSRSYIFSGLPKIINVQINCITSEYCSYHLLHISVRILPNIFPSSYNKLIIPVFCVYFFCFSICMQNEATSV